MNYKHLDRIHELLNVPSTSEFKIGRSTKPIKKNHEDACGALAVIKRDCGHHVGYAADCYCAYDPKSNSYLTLRFLLHAKMIEWFKRDNKDISARCLLLTDIALGKVFAPNQQTTDDAVAVMMGIRRQSYAQTWRKYVDDAEGILLSLLSQADIAASEYFYQEGVAQPA